jgi:hypothetical protein
MSEKRQETYEELREAFERKLKEPLGYVDPPEPPKAEVFELQPWRHRRWTAEPTNTSSYVAVEPTVANKMEELRREVAAAARKERMRCDPLGIGLYGVGETIDDVVRRQDKTR